MAVRVATAKLVQSKEVLQGFLSDGGSVPCKKALLIKAFGVRSNAIETIKCGAIENENTLLCDACNAAFRHVESGDYLKAQDDSDEVETCHSLMSRISAFIRDHKFAFAGGLSVLLGLTTITALALYSANASSNDDGVTLCSNLTNTTLPTPSAAALEGVMEPNYNHPYLDDSHAGFTNKNWMSSIPNNTRLSLISIPGTHNSLSLYGGDAVRTQSLGVTEQLNMGIRYFDARFKYRNNNLYAYHGPIYQYQTFDELLKKVSAFLDENPTETILIRTRNEDGHSVHKDEFYQCFMNTVNNYKSRNIVPYPPVNYAIPGVKKNYNDSMLELNYDNPMLGSVRGRFVIIFDFIPKSGIGIQKSYLAIQDAYKLTSNWDLHNKWQEVKKHFNSIKGNAISLNHLSGSVGSFPYFVASGKSSPATTASQLWTGISTTSKAIYPDFPRASCVGELCSINFAGINQLTNAWIEKRSAPSNLGIVAMDFPGGRLVDNIIQSNYRFISVDQSARCAANAFVVYSHINQQSQALKVNSDLSSLGDMDNRMSSYQIPTGWQVRFYEDANYKGNHWTRTAGKGNARDGGFDNKISSIKIIYKDDASAE